MHICTRNDMIDDNYLYDVKKRCMYLKYLYMFSNKSTYNVNKLCVIKITDNIHDVAALRIYAM